MIVSTHRVLIRVAQPSTGASMNTKFVSEVVDLIELFDSIYSIQEYALSFVLLLPWRREASVWSAAQSNRPTFRSSDVVNAARSMYR